jgi:hypothetical protein
VSSAPLGPPEKKPVPRFSLVCLCRSVLGFETYGLVFTGRESNGAVAVVVFRRLRELKSVCEGFDGAAVVGLYELRIRDGGRREI